MDPVLSGEVVGREPRVEVVCSCSSPAARLNRGRAIRGSWPTLWHAWWPDSAERAFVRGETAAVVIDRPVGVAGADWLRPEIDDPLRANGVAVTNADRDWVLRAASNNAG